MLKDFFQRIGKKDESVLGVDISASSIKVVQLKHKKGRAILETYGEIALGPYAGADVGHATSLPPDRIAEALRDLLIEAKTTTKNAGIAIPYSSSLISMIEMPAVGEDKLAEMIPLEARKFIPVPVSEVMLDWSIVPRSEFEDDDSEKITKDERGSLRKVKVLVVAIHKDTINKFQNIADTAGLSTSFFEIEVFSTIRAVMHGEPEPIMIFDLGADTTKMFIVEQRTLRDTHIINRGSQDITKAIAQSLALESRKAEELKREVGVNGESENKNLAQASSLVLDSILNEGKRVMLNYEKQNNTTISKVIVSGGGSILKGFLSMAEKAFESEVELALPFGKVETPAFLNDVLSQAGPEFTVAIGVALRKLDELS